MDGNKLYRIVFNPQVYPPNKNDFNKIPYLLFDALVKVGAKIKVYSAKREFVSVSLPKNKVDDVKGLEGILSVTIE